MTIALPRGLVPTQAVTATLSVESIFDVDLGSCVFRPIPSYFARIRGTGDSISEGC